jgi:hypothetical protein
MLTVRSDEQRAVERQATLEEDLDYLGDDGKPSFHIARASGANVSATQLRLGVRGGDRIQMSVELECGTWGAAVPAGNDAGALWKLIIEGYVKANRAQNARIHLRSVRLLTRRARNRHEL